MFRVRMALLSLIVVAALPSAAQAKTSKYCKLFSSAEVGKAVGLRGIRLESTIQSAPSATGKHGRAAVCEFFQGSTHVAESSVMAWSSAKVAGQEFAAQIRGRTDGPALRRIAGPWHRAYEHGPNEVYMLKGRYLFHMLYEQNPSADPKAGAVKRLAARAARKL
jgi:hypothetical protein